MWLRIYREMLYWLQQPSYGPCLLLTWSLSSDSCLERSFTMRLVDSRCACKILISFCSLSPSSLARDMALIRGNQSSCLSYKQITCHRGLFTEVDDYLVRIIRLPPSKQLVKVIQSLLYFFEFGGTPFWLVDHMCSNAKWFI